MELWKYKNQAHISVRDFDKLLRTKNKRRLIEILDLLSNNATNKQFLGDTNYPQPDFKTGSEKYIFVVHQTRLKNGDPGKYCRGFKKWFCGIVPCGHCGALCSDQQIKEHIWARNDQPNRLCSKCFVQYNDISTCRIEAYRTENLIKQLKRQIRVNNGQSTND